MSFGTYLKKKLDSSQRLLKVDGLKLPISVKKKKRKKKEKRKKKKKDNVISKENLCVKSNKARHCVLSVVISYTSESNFHLVCIFNAGVVQFTLL